MIEGLRWRVGRVPFRNCKEFAVVLFEHCLWKYGGWVGGEAQLEYNASFNKSKINTLPVLWGTMNA